MTLAGHRDTHPGVAAALASVVDRIGQHPLKEAGTEDSAGLRPAAVLVPIVLAPNGVEVLLTVRNQNLNSHPGQISFPGGRVDASDRDVGHTALRESEEELGITPDHVQLLGSLDPYLTSTGFSVVPVVGLLSPGYCYQLAEHEVAEAFHVPLAFVLNPENYREIEREFSGQRRRYFEIWFNDYRIWGATAGMIVGLQRRLHHTGLLELLRRRSS